MLTATYCCSSGALAETSGRLTRSPYCVTKELVSRKKISSSSTMSVSEARLKALIGLRPEEKSKEAMRCRAVRGDGGAEARGVSHEPPLVAEAHEPRIRPLSETGADR